VHRVLFIPTVAKKVRRPGGTLSAKASGLQRHAAVFVMSAAIATLAPSTQAAWPGRIELPSRTMATRSIEVHGVSPARAEVVRRHAEEVRRRVFAELLGVSAPRPWAVPCEIHVHESAEAFEHAVGGPPAAASGATSIEFAGDAVSLRRIDVMSDGADGVPDALAHELVHVVLADRFPLAPPPRWADEGLAVLFDAPEKQAGHDADFAAARRDGMAWSATHFLAMADYPAETGRQRVFYGQSVALVRWLIARGGIGTFMQFVEDASLDGATVSLDRHYGLASSEALDRAWLGVAPIGDVSMD